MDTLGIFAKWPEPGQVKTRLGQAFTPAFAAAIARAFLLDTLQRFGAVDCERFLVFAPPAQAAAFAEIAPTGYTLMPQAPGDLGARLSAFFAQTPGKALALGTDSPTLPVAFVEEALKSLQRANVVIGPATDGGYYLIGCRGHHPGLFQGIEWSSSRVLQQTVERVRALGLRLEVLPPWYDVDTAADWQMLQGHLAALREAGMAPGVTQTEEVIRRAH